MQFGPYTIDVTVRANCRHLILRCREGRLYLSVPPGVSQQKIRAFLAQRTDWMARQIACTRVEDVAYRPGERHCVAGEYVTLGQDGVPAGEQAFLAWRAKRLMEAVAVLRPVWEQRMGVQASGVRYREMVSRWGSCPVSYTHLTLPTKA